MQPDHKIARSGNVRVRSKRSANKWPYLIGAFLILIVFTCMRTERTSGYIYVADRYHQFQKNLIKLKYIYESP